MIKENTSDSLIIPSPIGRLKLEGAPKALTGVQFMGDGETLPDNSPESSPILQKAQKQLEEYFAGNRKTFNLNLQPSGTEFELNVWYELKQVPYGTSITYKQLAQRLGDENKVRAVGRANGKNPIPIVIPCHRVIGSNGQLVGYGGGIERKKWLLRREGSLLL